MEAERQAPRVTAVGAGPGSIATVAGSVVVAIGTILAIFAVIVLLFFNPWWVGFEQERAGADLFTGYPMSEVHRVTDAMIAEVYFGPGTFEESVDGQLVLDPRERSHMADVRTVLGRFFLVAGMGIVALAVAGFVARGARWFWRGVAAGSLTLLIVGGVVGVAVTIAFDAAFELFHELLFPAGSFDFNPLTERLVQIFPGQLFDETGIAVAVVGLVLAVGLLILAGRRLRGAAR